MLTGALFLQSQFIQAQAPIAPVAGSAVVSTPKGNSKISGIVSDSAAAKPVEFASVALVNASDNKVIDGTVADVDGKFEITSVAPGKYKLLISFLGFKDKSVSNISVEKGKDINLGKIQMVANTKTLDEVTITG